MLKKQTLVLGPILLLSTALAWGMLTNGHDWGDDFAAYIMQSAGLLHGSVREPVAHMAFTMRESSRPYGPAAAPWGFPLLLAPYYMACGGTNIFCLKLVNLQFFGLFLIAFFQFLKRRVPLIDSAIVVSILAFSPVLLSFQNNILSDITFLFLSTLSILLIDAVIVTPRKTEASVSGHVWLGIACFLGFCVRPNGILLVLTVGLSQMVCGARRRASQGPSALRTALIPHVVFGLLVVALLMTLPGGETSYLSAFSALTPRVLWENLLAYAVMPIEFFESMPFHSGAVLCGVLLPCTIAGAVLRRKDDFPALIYIGLTLLLYIAWPFQEGLRYLFPLLPFLLSFAYCGTQAAALAVLGRYRRGGPVARSIARAAWTPVLAVFLVASFNAARVNLLKHRATDDGPFEPNSAAMLDAIRTRTTTHDVVLFWKPRAMLLLTGRDALLVDRCDELGRGQYAVIKKNNGAADQVRPNIIATCSSGLTVTRVFENQQYAMYRLAPNVGNP